MSTKYKATSEGSVYFITCTIVDWIDLFTRLSYKHIIIDSLEHCQKEKGLEIYGWCLMPSHLHILCASDQVLMSDMMRDFKKHTSKKLIATIKEEPESRREWLLEQFSKACSHLKQEQNYKVWQNGYHAKEVWSSKFANQKLNYIHNNPVEEGYVEVPEDYLFSSAKDYSGQKGLLKVELLLPELST